MPARFNLRHPTVAVNAALVVAMAGGSLWAYEALFGSSNSNNAASSSVQTVAVQTGTVTKTVTADGTVESASTASASFITGGTITAVKVKVGQVVQKGQVLAKVDPAASKRSLQAAEADLDSANDSLDQAEDAGSDTSSAESGVESAEQAVDDAQDAVDGTVLTAPMAGTVTAVNGTLGSSVSGGGSSSSSSDQSSSSSSSSSGFVEIADLSKLQVTTGFAEADATELKEKQAATISWTALTGATATGKVMAVDPSATTSNSVVTYSATLSIDKNPTGAKVGQSVSVSVTTGSVANATYVNSAAVTTAGTKHTVTVVTNGAKEVRQVEIGLEGDSTTQIKSGVQAGEQVLLNLTSTTTDNNTGQGGGLSNLGGGLSGGGGPPAGGGGP